MGGSHMCRKPRLVGSHICRKPRWGDPIPPGSQTWNPISAGNLDGGGGGGGRGGPISAGNLDCGSHISRNSRSDGIPYLQET